MATAWTVTDIPSLEKKLTPDVKTLSDSGDFSEAFNKASSQGEKTAVVDLYFLNGPLKAYWDNINQAQPTLERICLELGLDENDNPFLVFLKKFFNDPGNSSVKFKNDDMIVLNNAYAKSVIEFEDLAGTNYEGTKSVIYNKFFYDMSREDEEFILSTYMWLENISNVDRMNFNAIITDNQLGFVSGSGASINVTANTIAGNSKNVCDFVDGIWTIKKNINTQLVRNAILLIDASKPKGKLQKIKDVKRAMTDASSKKGLTKTAGIVDEIVRAIKKLDPSIVPLIKLHVEKGDEMSDADKLKLFNLITSKANVSDVVNRISRLSDSEKADLKTALGEI